MKPSPRSPPGDGSPGACPTSRGPRASSARRPTTGSLPAFARSAEQRCRPRARPRRTGRPSYAATRPTSKRFPGNGGSAARSSENRPRSSVSLRQCGFVASSRHRSGSPALKFSRLHTLGRGTNSLRRTIPGLGLHRALLMTGIRVAQRAIEPVMRPEGLEQAPPGAARAPRTPYGPRRRRYRTRSACLCSLRCGRFRHYF